MAWWASGNARTRMGPQAREAQRLDRRVLGTADPGVGPAPAGGVIIARQVIVFGPNGGEFVYDASGNLRAANVGGVTTDPKQGITCQQGFSTFNGHGAVINLLSTANGAFFQYADTGTSTQGALILSTASVAGTDPVTFTTYPAGQQGINPVFGSFTQLLGSAIVFGVASTFSRNASVGVTTGSGASPPYLETDSPEQTTASHALLRLQGASPDGTVPAQALIAAVAGAATITRVSNALLEVQGGLSLGAVAAANVEIWLIPSGDATGVKDTAAINSALSSFKRVHLLPGTFFVNAPIVVPSGVTLTGAFRSWGVPGDNYGAGGLPLQGSIIKAVAAFSGATIMSLPTPVPNTNQGGGQVLEHFTIDGTSLPGGNSVNGIQALGFIGAVTMRYVCIWTVGGHGLFLNNDGTAGHNVDDWDVSYCKIAENGSSGVFAFALTDSVFSMCEFSGNNVSGVHLDSGFNNRFIGCRADSNAGSTGPGFDFPGGFLGYTGTTYLLSCISQLNGIGYRITQTGGTVYLLDCKSDGNTTSYTYSGTSLVNSSASYSISTASPTLNGTSWNSMTGGLVAGFGAGSTTPRYELEGFVGGRVRLSGIVALTANQVAGTTFFTLPAGFRPASNKFFDTRSNFGGGLICIVDIQTTGAMIIQTAGSTGQVFVLDGITFELD